MGDQYAGKAFFRARAYRIFAPKFRLLGVLDEETSI